MMLPTHAMVGLVLALPVVYGLPELGSVAMLAGFLGGVFPDLDMYVGHRKTLHYPVYYPLAGIAGLPVVLVATTPLTVGVEMFLISAAVHSVTDVFGGGLELRPWEGTSERAVYDHHRDRWIEPRRWVRYDGAPEDLLISLILAIPLSFSLERPFLMLVVLSVGVAGLYSLVRRRLPPLAEWLVNRVLVPRLPENVRHHLPERYRREEWNRTGYV